MALTSGGEFKFLPSTKAQRTWHFNLRLARGTDCRLEGIKDICAYSMSAEAVSQSHEEVYRSQMSASWHHKPRQEGLQVGTSQRLPYMLNMTKPQAFRNESRQR